MRQGRQDHTMKALAKVSGAWLLLVTACSGTSVLGGSDDESSLSAGPGGGGAMVNGSGAGAGGSVGACVGRACERSDTWTEMSDTGAPTLEETSTVWTGSEMIVWGGSGFVYGSATSFARIGARYDPT